MEYNLDACSGNLLGKSAYPRQITPFSVTNLSFYFVYSQLPPYSEAKSTIIEPGFMESTICFKINFGAGFPGINAVVIMISTSLAYFAKIAISASMNSLDIVLEYPPAASPSSLILTSKNSAPKDCTYSLVADLVSKHLTIAPNDLAVAMALNPATPAPIIITLAGGILPAAVI